MVHTNPRARLGHDFRVLAKLSRRGLYFPFSGGTLTHVLVKLDRKTVVVGPYTPTETTVNEDWSKGEALITIPASDLLRTLPEQDTLLQLKVVLGGVEYFWPDTVVELRYTGL